MGWCVEGAKHSTLVVNSPPASEILDENDAKNVMTLSPHTSIIKSYSNLKRGATSNLMKKIFTPDQQHLQNCVASTWGSQR